MSKKRKLRFLSKSSMVETDLKDSDDQKICLYSARSAVVAEFESLANEVIVAVQGLLKDEDSARASSSEIDRRGVKKGGEIAHEKITNTLVSVDPAVLAQIDETRREGVRTVVRSLVGSESRRALSMLVISSMRDHYEADPETGLPLKEDVEEYLKETDIETFVAFGTAAVQANWKALTKGFRKTLPAKEAKDLSGKIAGVVGRVQSKMDKVLPSSSTEPASTSSQEGSTDES